MSQMALLLAVRDQLRETAPLELRREECEVTHDGSPLPIAGERFAAVWPGYWRDAGSNGTSLSEEYGVNVTVSFRLPRVPLDRVGPELLAKANTGLLALCEKIRAVIHMDPQDSLVVGVLPRANQLINATEENGFLLPLQFLDGGRAEVRPGWRRR